MEKVVLAVKGLEQSAYDSRAGASMALAYATSDIGAHHTRAWTIAREVELGKNWSDEERVDLVIYHQTLRPLFDMLGVCRLPWIELGLNEEHYARFYSAVTGREATLADLLRLSNDVYTLTRLINARLGMSRKDDTMPYKVFNNPIRSGPTAGKVIDRQQFERLLDLYYRKRGWDANGIPPTGAEAAFGAAVRAGGAGAAAAARQVTRSRIVYTTGESEAMRPIIVRPRSTAISYAAVVGMLRDANTGTPAATAFCAISAAIRPELTRQHREKSIRSTRPRPITLSTALCRPTSSYIHRSPPRSARPALCMPPPVSLADVGAIEHLADPPLDGNEREGFAPREREGREGSGPRGDAGRASRAHARIVRAYHQAQDLVGGRDGTARQQVTEGEKVQVAGRAHGGRDDRPVNLERHGPLYREVKGTGIGRGIGGHVPFWYERDPRCNPRRRVFPAPTMPPRRGCHKSRSLLWWRPRI